MYEILCMNILAYSMYELAYSMYEIIMVQALKCKTVGQWETGHRELSLFLWYRLLPHSFTVKYTKCIMFSNYNSKMPGQ